MALEFAGHTATMHLYALTKLTNFKFVKLTNHHRPALCEQGFAISEHGVHAGWGRPCWADVVKYGHAGGAYSWRVA